MPEKETIVKGEVGKIIAWKTGKGYFLNLKGDPNDYFGWKECKCSEGEKVKLTVTEGTGSFADKLLITHTDKPTVTLAEIKQTKKDADEIVQHSVMQGNKFYLARETLIIKQTCIKAAAEVVGHLVERTSQLPGAKVADAVIYLADRFYLYVTEQEEPEQPEPEA